MSDATTPRHKSHGTGEFRPEQFRAVGPDCVFEAGVLVFHPENITLGRNVYVGHHDHPQGLLQERAAHRRRDLDRPAGASSTPRAG